MFATWQIASAPVAPEVEQLREDIDFLSSEVAGLRTRLDRALDRTAVLEQETDIQRSANRMLRQQEADRQAEINRMQSELDFFRGLAGTGGTREGLDVYRVELIETGSPRVYQYVLTLTQNIRRASIINGKVGIQLEGTLDDRPVTLYWAQLSDGNTPEPDFRFKYFQQLEGYLSLPENFLPLRLRVTLDARGQRRPVQASWTWPELFESPAPE